MTWTVSFSFQKWGEESDYGLSQESKIVKMNILEFRICYFA